MREQLQKYDPKKTYERARNAVKTGGYLMKFIKAEGYSKAAKNVYNQFSDKIAKGQIKDIINLTKPIETCDSSTFLENIANEIHDSYQYFARAYEAKDPVDTMKWLVAAAISSITASLHRLEGRLPLDPIIGETYQGILPDGPTVDVECLSSNPPEYSMITINQKTGFQLSCFYKVNASLNGVNSVWAGSSGGFIFKSKAGHVFRIGHADIVINGALYGQPTYNLLGSLEIKCEALNLETEIKFDAFKNDFAVVKLAKGIMGMFSSQKQSKPSDYMTIEIFQTSGQGKKQQKVVLAKGSGSWVSHIEIDGLIYWKYTENYGVCGLPKIILPSDSRIRQDRKLMIENKLQDAQKAKIQLEALQRHDAALRKNYQKK